jgi:hypothetical protein
MIEFVDSFVTFIQLPFTLTFTYCYEDKGVVLLAGKYEVCHAYEL